MLTYILFKTKSMLLSEKASQVLTYILFKTRACFCQQQVEKVSQLLTYILFKTQSMPSSATSKEGQPDADLHPVQSPEYAPISNKQEWSARCWLTACLKPKACFCQQQVGMASQMLTYRLFKTQSMLLSATSMKSQPDADLQPVQNPEHTLVSNTQRRQVRCWLTYCLIPEHGLVSNKQEGAADLQTVQNPGHALVSNKQGRPVRCRLTFCSKPRGCSCQLQARKPASCWLTSC